MGMNTARNADVGAIIGNASNGVVSIERRTGRDRRAGVDRRNCSVPVAFDRRGGDDRRSGFDRRAKGLEPLEARSMFSAVSFENGILMVRGDANSPNDIVVNLNGNKVVANIAGQSASADQNKIRFIRIIGGEQADKVVVNPNITADVHVQSGGGNDTIMTGAGNDLVIAGNGNDWVETGAGNDFVRAGNGRDTVIAGAGHDTVLGGNGSDSILGGKGNDRIDGESGDDRIRGEAGNDRLNAGKGRDLLRGGTGADTIVSTAGDDAKGNGGSDKVVLSTDGKTIDASTRELDANGLPRALTFSLINADTNQPIAGYENLSNGATLDLAKLPTRNLNISANVPAAFGGSVQFKLNGKNIATEGIAPYALAGDSGGKFNAWQPVKGENSLVATAYTGKGGRGLAGLPVQVNFKVVDGKTNTGGNTGSTPVNPGNGNTGGTPVNPGTGNTGSNGNSGNNGIAGGNETPNPNAAAPTARIELISTVVQAGHSIHVNALQSRINSGSQLSARFEWDFGEPGAKYNKLQGFNAAHNYARAGTYTIKLKVTDNTGKSDTTSQTITVRESTRKMYYVSNSGSDTNDGTSPATAIRSWDRVRQLLNDNTEFRFKAGETFSVGNEMMVNGSNVVFGMYGAGNRPTLLWTQRFSGFKRFFDVGKGSTDVTVRDLTFDSVFTQHQFKTGVPDVARPAGKNFTAINNQMFNVSYFVNGEMKPRGVLVQENNSPLKTGLRAYLSYIVGTDWVVTGNTVANSTAEHCVRADGGQRVLIAHNDLTNIAQGRPGNTVDIMKQTITVHWGSDYTIYGNQTTGGRIEIGPLGEGDGLRPSNIGQRLNRVLIDSNIANFGNYQRLEIDHGTSGVLIRNNVLNTPTGAGIIVSATAKYTAWPQYGERGVSNVWITDDNTIKASNRVSVGRGSSNINIAA